MGIWRMGRIKFRKAIMKNFSCMLLCALAVLGQSNSTAQVNVVVWDDNSYGETDVPSGASLWQSQAALNELKAGRRWSMNPKCDNAWHRPLYYLGQRI